MVDSEFLQKGKEYSELPDAYIIYISEEDIWKAGKTTYSVVKSFAGTDIEYDDGVKILYVNTHVDDGSETAGLMKYFTEADPYDDSQGDLSKRIHFLKCEEGGQEIMCEVTERLIEMGIEQGLEQGIVKNKLETVQASLKQGLSIEIIAAITGFTVEEIKKIAASK